MKISELSKKTGVSQRMLRYMEQLGLLKPRRTEAEYRNYTSEDIESVLKIRELQRLGMSLREIGHLNKSPELATQILEDVFLRERSLFLEKKRSLRDLRERFTGTKNPYGHRTAYRIPKLEGLVEVLGSKGWSCTDCTYWQFSEWEEGQLSTPLSQIFVSEIIRQSSFFVTGSYDLIEQDQLQNLSRDFCKAAHQQWALFDGYPPRPIEPEDLGEFFAPSEIIATLNVSKSDGKELFLILPYQVFFALAQPLENPL